MPSREREYQPVRCGTTNFRRALLLSSREENISSLGAAVQHDFRRTLLVPSREENIKKISMAWASRYSRARSG